MSVINSHNSNTSLDTTSLTINELSRNIIFLVCSKKRCERKCPPKGLRKIKVLYAVTEKNDELGVVFLNKMSQSKKKSWQREKFSLKLLQYL